MSRGTLKTIALAVVAVLVFVATWSVVLLASQRQTTVGAHDATLRPTLDGHVTIIAGPLLPEVRLSTGGPVGAQIVLRDSPTHNLNQMLARDAVIASAPRGETARVSTQVRSVLVAATFMAAACAMGMVLLVVIAWKLIGAERRRQLVASWPPSPKAAIGTAVISAMVLVTAFMATPSLSQDRQQVWVPIRSEFPELDELPQAKNLSGVEVSQGAAAAGASTLIRSGLTVYRDSVKFYGRLKLHAEAVTGLHTPQSGEQVAIVVTDRHDNIAMDPIARTIADKGGASFLIDLGDDTSGGDRWEDFSQQSLRSNFKKWPVFWVAGNHDHGPTTTKLAKKLGFRVMDGAIVEQDGVRMLGDADPRSTGLLSGYSESASDNSRAMRDQSDSLAATACDAKKPVSLMITHSITSAQATIDRGCVDLAIAGHLHRQVGPTIATNGTTNLTIGSTGGAVAGFALGSALRREAQVALLTFKDGRVVGLQIVTFTPGAAVRAEPYLPLPGRGAS